MEAIDCRTVIRGPRDQKTGPPRLLQRETDVDLHGHKMVPTGENSKIADVFRAP